MSDQQPKQTPILDLLRDIPADAHMVYEVNPTHHQSIPVGVLAHQAADEIDRLRAVLAAARALTGESEEYEFEEGTGRGAANAYWEGLDDALEAIDAAKEQR